MEFCIFSTEQRMTSQPVDLQERSKTMTDQVRNNPRLKPPDKLGKHLLIAVDNNERSLKMTQDIADCIPAPSKTHITLIHYIEPVYWEHGGDCLETVRHIEKQILETEQGIEAKTDQYFAKSQAILKNVGVSQIKTKKCWAAHNVADAILQELENGFYTGVIMGGHLHTPFAQLFIRSPVDIVCQHAKNVIVWLIENP